MRNVSSKVLEIIKAHFIFNNLYPKMVQLWGNVEKYGTARQAMDENIRWCMHFTC
jgi:hypothetical protein